MLTNILSAEAETHSPIKAVFFDLDGTLVSFQTHAVPLSAERALARLQEQGIKVLAATGRSIDALAPVRYLNFDGFITYNGGCCVTADGHVLRRHTLDSGDVQRLLDYAVHQPLNYVLMYENSVAVNRTTPEMEAMYTRLNLPVPPVVERAKTELTQVLQANVFLGPEAEHAFMEQVMPNSVATRWTPLFADVNPQGISKKVGVDVFCEHFGLDVSETMSFGDGGNDVTMLQYTGLSVAMGNAAPHVQDSADYVTAETDHDGIAQALTHFGLL
ncbi:Cof-type HAD-IIB family hydrolase [Hymenobacter sp. GOD-10R]|uniref:Cof-type HAD-IIB family hydrolase n=1 Tax=Hymenobacter sp. GOD-10R TaxID=3093922 RepID=UPI002D78DF73|nr:Cof-type HAD-IIB family hydrolase [Hymenobacter sp. GOD-10R]WRQ31080.1 Cof-type HAD-IIB family hydrolase [Hymenobacter sp. GOD-10R]